MRKDFSQVGKCALLALSLGVATPQSTIALNEATTVVANNSQQQIARVSKINPTTVEVVFANSQRASFDFFGQNIFRLFQDNNGGIIRDPKANPEAQILVNSPRRAVGEVEVKKEQGGYAISTPRIEIKLNEKTGLMTVIDCEKDKVVIEEIAPKLFEGKKTTLTLAGHDNEYFYGGGVQNGRFSHKGKVIAIENTNNWVDGGVASPTPFYWSTLCTH